jgi:uncharacterized protein YndB with AHSA1/START domain
VNRLTDTTAPGQTQALAFEVDLPHPPAKVWRALTTPELLAEWLLPTVGFDVAPGTTFRFETDPYPGWDGVVHCEILASDPPRSLSYRWDVPFLQTVVSFTLTPSAAGTRLSIVQSGFNEQQKREFGGARYGWQMMGGRLVDLLARIP